MKPIDSHPILSCADAKTWEAGLLKDEVAEWEAMQRAGRAIARAIEEDFLEIGGLPISARLLVLVGKGHNGGDALLAARSMVEKYPQAEADVLLCFGESALRPLARRSLDHLREIFGHRANVRSVSGLSASERVDLLGQGYDLCLDGIFGFQFRPPMDDTTAEVIARVNTHPRIKFRAAVDLPSGMGDLSAATVFRADFTYATGIVKSPAVAEINAACVGRLRYLDLGFFARARVVSNVPKQVLLPSVLTPLAELRPAQSDKRTYGHLCIVGGSHRYPGAVILAVRAALRSGAGLVTAFVPEELAPHGATQHPEVMWVGCPLTRAGGLGLTSLSLLREPLKRATALLIGPGLGADQETLELVRQLVSEANVPVVLDADALRTEVISALQGKPFVCTPHAGEFKRIAGAHGIEEFCETSGAIVVLKGPLTRIVGRALRPTGSPDVGHKARPTSYYSPFGGPVLARGGSGDMLAGLIGGLLAQTPESPLLAACRGVVWHGMAADLLARTHGQVAVENSQLLEQLGPALTLPHARLIDRAAGVHGSERPA